MTEAELDKQSKMLASALERLVDLVEWKINHLIWKGRDEEVHDVLLQASDAIACYRRAQKQL